MGSGPVETATSAEALLARFQCQQGFSVGPIGRLSNKLKLGEWYRVASVIPYQRGAWTSVGFEFKGALTRQQDAEHTRTNLLPGLLGKLESISVASGEVFVSSTSYHEQLAQQTGADAVDMNLFGLTSVCSDHHLPVQHWRIVSDNADNDAGEDFKKFLQQYDGAGGKALAEPIKNLPADPNSPQSYPELHKLLQQK